MSLLSNFMRKSRDTAHPQRESGGAPSVPPNGQMSAGPTGPRGQKTTLMIACPDPTREDRARDAHRLRGQFLARQDRWDTLSKELRAADDQRDATPGAMPVAELLSYGARSDVVMAAEHALLDGKPDRDIPVSAGIEALEEMLAEQREDPMRAVVVAQAHMDLGWAWRGTAPTAQVAARNREAFEAHFDRANDILAAFERDCADSPFYLAAKCALNGAGLMAQGRISRDFERLIDLQPMNPGPMRALGTYLSPRWFGSHGELELEARRTAARTQAAWGAGGYTWVMFDAIAGDPVACANLDVDFFIEGLEDILDHLPDQYCANLLAAFCAHLHPGRTTGDDKADATRARIGNCADWIVRNHMTELHPLIWAHAAAGFANNVNVPSPRRFAAMGRRDGLQFIATLFHREIAQGRRIIFTAEGPVAETC